MDRELSSIDSTVFYSSECASVKYYHSREPTVAITLDNAPVGIDDWVDQVVGLSSIERRMVERPGPRIWVNRRIKLEALTAKIVECHCNGAILLSPSHFTMEPDLNAPNFFIDAFLEKSEFGRSVTRGLEAHGVMVFIDRQSKEARSYYVRFLRRILASLVASTTGLDDISLLPEDVFRSWIYCFKQHRGVRWNENLWEGSKLIAFQCLREIVFAFAKLSKKPELALLAVQQRSDAAHGRNWADLLRSESSSIKPWMDMYARWRTSKKVFAGSAKQTIMHLISWMAPFSDEIKSNIPTLMSSSDLKPSFVEYLRSRKLEGVKRQGSTYITYISQAQKFGEFIRKELIETGVRGEFYPFVQGTDIGDEKDKLRWSSGTAARPNQAQSRPLPQRLYRMTRAILEEGEGGWPGRCRVCLYSARSTNGTVELAYCPVLASLFLSLFELPARVGQMKRLDSGEGDVERFDGHELTWGKNQLATAGYWKERGDKRPRGYAWQSRDENVTGFFINTDKGGRPYTVPWQNPNLHRILYDLRLWQEKKNPTAAPIPPEMYIDDASNADPGRLQRYPWIFPLFRIPSGCRGKDINSVPSSRRTSEFWQLLMTELERRLQLDNPGVEVRIVQRQRSTGQPHGARYTPHGLRVAGLTWLVSQNVPIHIVSALVAGHKSIVMTLYYMNMSPAEVHRQLSLATENKAGQSEIEAIAELQEANYEKAKLRTVSVQLDSLVEAVGMARADKSFFTNMGIGICPWEAGRCHDGGALKRKSVLRSGRDLSVYGPVEGGNQNCPLCRHFITGPAWIVPLWLEGTKLLRECARLGARIQELTADMSRLQEENTSADPADRRRLQRDLELIQVECDGLMQNQELAAKSLLNVQKLLEECQAVSLANGSNGRTLQLLAQPEHALVGYEEASEFEQAALLVAGAKIYPRLYDQDAESAREKFLDDVLWNSGITPLSLAPLSREAKARGMDAMTQFLLDRVERQELRSLNKGSTTLASLGLLDGAAKTYRSAVGVSFEIAVKPARDIDLVDAVV